jgi:hypothetical protein
MDDACTKSPSNRPLIIIFLAQQPTTIAAINLSPRNMKACHSVNTDLLQSVAEIVTESAMKLNKMTWHEFTSHIPKNAEKEQK